jgi:hypothetical protein
MAELELSRKQRLDERVRNCERILAEVRKKFPQEVVAITNQIYDGVYQCFEQALQSILKYGYSVSLFPVHFGYESVGYFLITSDRQSSKIESKVLDWRCRECALEDALQMLADDGYKIEYVDTPVNAQVELDLSQLYCENTKF